MKLVLIVWINQLLFVSAIHAPPDLDELNKRHSPENSRYYQGQVPCKFLQPCLRFIQIIVSNCEIICAVEVIRLLSVCSDRGTVYDFGSLKPVGGNVFSNFFDTLTRGFFGVGRIFAWSSESDICFIIRFIMWHTGSFSSDNSMNWRRSTTTGRPNA